jgi:pyrimidine-nucleoside phosphorylase
MHALDIIRKKRDGSALSGQEIEALLAGYLAREIPDYQMAAFLMAVFFSGMTHEETWEFTQAMVRSGCRIDLAEVPGRKVDKHSTGGVGDKVSLIAAPLVAACGVPVPMISGRGLGHTGGTLDKLESIPGMRTDLSVEEFTRTLARAHLAFAGQTDEFVPADRMLYALRDVTATVESFPLMAGSIMSKKIAEGTDALVLDVKFGSGAFLATAERAEEFARLLVTIGTRAGMQTVALVSSMEQPLGHAVGNWLEVEEAVACLRGKHIAGLGELVEAISGMMVMLGGNVPTLEEGIRRCRRALWSGQAYEKFLEVVRLQGGDPSTLGSRRVRPPDLLSAEVRAASDGVVQRFETRTIGEIATWLGAGRQKIDDPVDPLAGITLAKKIGDRVTRGEVLATLSSRRSEALREGCALMERVIELGAEPVQAGPVVRNVVDSQGTRAWSPPAVLP